MELDSFPDEVIVRIFHFCRPEDRRMLNLVNRRFNKIYKQRIPNLEFCFHLQGNTDTTFKLGLERLLTKDHTQFHLLKLSKFDLYRSFDKQFESDSMIFGKTYEEYATTCRTCKDITEIEVRDCCISDKTLMRFRLLFPNISSLTLYRCLFIVSGEDLIQLDEQKISQAPIKRLKISLPFIAGSTRIGNFLEWLIDYCSMIDMLDFETSEVSNKRAAARRFLKDVNRKDLKVCTIWSSVLRQELIEVKKDKIKALNQEALNRFVG